MKIEQQVPRNALVWMIISLFTLVAPHLSRIPVWVLGIYLLAALWRIMVYRGRWSFPGRMVKLLLIVAGSVGVYLSFGTLVGLEPTVAMLLTAFAFKLIELASRKDAYVLLFLGYFICLLQYLFSQEMPVVLYSLLNILVVTTGLVALHQPGQHQFTRSSVQLASVMLLQALPLMLLLFFLFPRFGPLWSVPMQSHGAKTGISDFMRPGDISNLSKSDEVAFRVEFEGRPPPIRDMYWRGLVLSVLDDGTWRALELDQVPELDTGVPSFRPRGEPRNYSVIIEPTQQNWLYALAYPRSPTTGVVTTPDFLLHSMVEVREELQYFVRSWDRIEPRQELSDWRRRIETLLPGEGNPRTRELARRMRAAAGSDPAFVDAVLAHFTREPFHYTTRPPLLDAEHRMDQFLFESRRGFCEHFAAAFVTLMRAADVPARVVIGYQGGEINPLNGTVIVHQFDAHAWAEVWLPGAGWQRVDPTGAVAPGRIESGLESAMLAEGGFLEDLPLSPLRFRNVTWINHLRLRYDALTYRWQKWVVGFDRERQFELLGRVIGEANPRRYALVLIGSFAVVMVPLAMLLLLRRPTRRSSRLDRDYLQFCQRLEARGIPREPGETPANYMARAATALPQLADQIRGVSLMYNRLAYGEQPEDVMRRRAMRRDFRQAVRRFGRRQPRPIM